MASISGSLQMLFPLTEGSKPPFSSTSVLLSLNIFPVSFCYESWSMWMSASSQHTLSMGLMSTEPGCSSLWLSTPWDVTQHGKEASGPGTSIMPMLPTGLPSIAIWPWPKISHPLPPMWMKYYQATRLAVKCGASQFLTDFQGFLSLQTECGASSICSPTMFAQIYMSF